MSALQEPARTLADARELLDGYLDYYREVVLRKLDGLSEQELRDSKVPSGWTPLELLTHLTWVGQGASTGGRFPTAEQAPVELLVGTAPD